MFRKRFYRGLELSVIFKDNRNSNGTSDDVFIAEDLVGSHSTK